jgi:hypothetical protein
MFQRSKFWYIWRMLPALAALASSEEAREGQTDMDSCDAGQGCRDDGSFSTACADARPQAEASP